jgi:hypothetical protein
MTNADRQACFYSHNELVNVLFNWRATSDEEKRAVIVDAIAALAGVPLPDDVVQEDEAL